MQQSTVSLYTSNAQFKKWNREIIPLKMASKYLRINLVKELQDCTLIIINILS